MYPILVEMRAMGVLPPRPPQVDASRMEVLRGLWAGAGLEAMEAREITVDRTFPSFDDFWRIKMTAPTLGPTVEAMAPADAEALKARVRAETTHGRRRPDPRMRPAPTPSKGGGRDKGRCRIRIVSPGEKRLGQQRLLLSIRCVVLNSTPPKREATWARRATSNSERGFLRGLQTYGDRDFSIYMRRAFAKSMGYSGDELARPVVGIAFTHSKFNPCHRHFPELLEAVKRGVAAAGGLALEFPTISLHEFTLAPNSMKFRNLMAMDTEEMIRAQPMDAVVLMGGCDKTVPAQLMGAASAGKPAIQLIGGPQMTSRYKDDRVGACTDCRKFWTQFRAGKMDKAEIEAVEGRLVTTAGTCAVMGTACTMAAIAEALGMTLPGTAAIPAVHADRLRAAEATGARAVALARSDLTPDKIITRGVGRERRARAAGARRLDQRRHPSGRHRRPRRA